MIIYFKDILDEEFVKDFVPKIIIIRASNFIKRKNTIMMNEYLRKNFDISLEDVINQLKFSFNQYNNMYSLSIDANIYENKSHEKLISLVKLIDSGNLEVKGLNIINSSMYYVKENLKGLYALYNMQERR